MKTINEMAYESFAKWGASGTQKREELAYIDGYVNAARDHAAEVEKQRKLNADYAHIIKEHQERIFKQEARIKELESKATDNGTTHAEGCHTWGSKHYQCALERIKELERECGLIVETTPVFRIKDLLLRIKELETERELRPMNTAPHDKRILVWTGNQWYAVNWSKNPYDDSEAWRAVTFEPKTADGNNQILVHGVRGWLPIPVIADLPNGE